jgi:hypothetical protein
MAVAFTLAIRDIDGFVHRVNNLCDENVCATSR